MKIKRKKVSKKLTKKKLQTRKSKTRRKLLFKNPDDEFPEWYAIFTVTPISEEDIPLVTGSIHIDYFEGSQRFLKPVIGRLRKIHVTEFNEQRFWFDDIESYDPISNEWHKEFSSIMNSTSDKSSGRTWHMGPMKKTMAKLVVMTWYQSKIKAFNDRADEYARTGKIVPLPVVTRTQKPKFIPPEKSSPQVIPKSIPIIRKKKDGI